MEPQTHKQEDGEDNERTWKGNIVWTDKESHAQKCLQHRAADDWFEVPKNNNNKKLCVDETSTYIQ